MGNQACARPCALYKKCTNVAQSSMYEQGDTAVNLSQEPTDQLKQYIEALSEVSELPNATPRERQRIFRRAITSRRQNIEQNLFQTITDFNQQVDAFKRNRRRIVETFLLSVAYSPCGGRVRKGLLRLPRNEICRADPDSNSEVRAILSTDRAFIRDVMRGASLSAAENRFYTGGYGV